MGQLLGKIVPIDMLAQMPLHFVRRLRDIRLKQIEEANKEQEQHMKKIQNNTGPQKFRPDTTGMDHAMLNGAGMEDFIDEISGV